MPVGKQRNMCQGFILNYLPLCSQAFNNVIDLDCVPVEDGIGNQAQATGLIHDFLVIPRCKLALIGKENPAWELVAVFALIELKLNRLSQFRIGEIAQDVLSLENTPKIGERLRQPVRRVAIGEPLDNHMCRCCPLLEGNGDSQHFFPLLLNDTEISSFCQ